MVSRALALDLDEDGEVCGSLAVPSLEGLEELETLRLGVDGHLNSETVLGRGLEGVFAWVVTARGKFVTVGGGELEGLAVSTDERVGDGVEAEVSSKGHRGDNIGGSDERVGGRIGVVTAGEITIIGSDDGVGFALLHVTTIPLADARTARIGKDDAADALEGTNHAITLDGGANLLRTGGDRELTLGLETVRSSLLRDGSRASHVLIRRVGARTDEADFELRWPAILLHLPLELRKRSREVRSERAVNVGFKLRQVLQMQ